jgi:hypothetical protein
VGGRNESGGRPRVVTYPPGELVGALLGGAGDGALGEEARAEEVDGHRRHPGRARTQQPRPSPWNTPSTLFESSGREPRALS